MHYVLEMSLLCKPSQLLDRSLLYIGEFVSAVSFTDGDDIEEIYKGNAPVPERLRPNQWDELFGATHNPDGSPKKLKGE